MHEALRDLGEALSKPFDIPAMRSLANNLNEGLAGLLLAADDAVKTSSHEDLALLRDLTADRDSLVDQMRRRVIAADKTLFRSRSADAIHDYKLVRTRGVDAAPL